MVSFCKTCETLRSESDKLFKERRWKEATAKLDELHKHQVQDHGFYPQESEKKKETKK